jgi:hypothetical protein
MIKSNLTVVVPTLGQRLETIKLAVDSITSVDSDTQIIFVAPKDICNILRDIYTDEQKFRYLLDKGLGLEECINVALVETKTDFWTWIGDDDLLVMNQVVNLIEVLRADPNIVFAYGDCAYINDSNEIIGINRFGNLATKVIKWGPNIIPQPSCIFRTKSVLEGGGLDSGLRYDFDQYLLQKLLAEGKSFYLRGISSKYRFSLSTLTSKNRLSSLVESLNVRLMFSSNYLKKMIQYLTFIPTLLIVLSSHLIFKIRSRKLL